MRPLLNRRQGVARIRHCSYLLSPEGGSPVSRSTLLRRGAVAAAVLALVRRRRRRGLARSRRRPLAAARRLVADALRDDRSEPAAAVQRALAGAAPRRARHQRPAGRRVAARDRLPPGDRRPLRRRLRQRRLPRQPADRASPSPRARRSRRRCAATSFGVDFNPTVDKIRVVSDAAQNLRLNVDEGTVLSADKDLNPGMPQVVGAGYTNSSFTATRPTATQLFAVDAAATSCCCRTRPTTAR